MPAPTPRPALATATDQAVGPAPVTLRTRSTRGQIRLPGGVFAMGDAFDEGYPDDGETPVHQVT
ncbi:MAG: formylglycine-rating enzyme, partial [Nocardioidaceae bacterium]|nr:formylglycine-rating enzyme [Nocardioidaceae bacterium]